MPVLISRIFCHRGGLFLPYRIPLSEKTNIMEVMHEEHRNEPVRKPGIWCGPVGMLLVLVGAVLGYNAPGLYAKLFSAYSPAWINILYAPVLSDFI